MIRLDQYARIVAQWASPPRRQPQRLTERQVAPSVYIAEDAKGQPHIIYGETTRQHLNDLSDPPQR